MKRYNVVINGVPTTLQLSDADAHARGLSFEEKAQTPLNKSKAPANKTRTPRTKRADA